MRERLAIARSRSHMDTCALESKADMLGVLLLRGIDNQDLDCLRRAKWILARNLTKRYHVSILRSGSMVWRVLLFLHDQRCPICEGRKFIRQETSVRACLTCEGSGLVGSLPLAWRKHHHLVLHESQAAMGRALKQSRAELEG